MNTFKRHLQLVASLYMILYNKRTERVLIRLRRCTRWSASLLSANPKARFSRADAQNIVYIINLLLL